MQNNMKFNYIGNLVKLIVISTLLNACASIKLIDEVDDIKIYNFLSYFLNSFEDEQSRIYNFIPFSQFSEENENKTLIIDKASDNNWYNVINSTDKKVYNALCQGVEWRKGFPDIQIENVCLNLSKNDFFFIEKQLSTVMCFEPDKFNTIRDKTVLTFSNNMEYLKLKKNKLRISKPVFSLNFKYAFIKMQIDERDPYLYIFKANKSSWNLIARYILEL